MRWQTGRRSSNVDDRRGRGGAGGRRGLAGGGLGLIAIVVLGLVFGVDPALLLQGIEQVSPPATQSTPGPRPEAENQLAEFVSVVLADTEDTWHPLFQQAGQQYQEPQLVLFTGATASACGHAQSAMGPFYCPGDHKVYIDLQFYDDMRNRFGAPGDFAQAYVIAHEVGHHVQTLLGISRQVRAAQQGASKVEANQLQVRMELQADCLAGIWAHHADAARQILEQGDIDEALNAAAAIGDDRLQKQAQGYVVPESFTHGSSAQRARWFKTGLQYGKLQQCDTFKAKKL